MGELVTIDRQAVALVVYEPKPGTKAIDVRRQMVQLPEVAEALTTVEKYVFAASCKTLISEMDATTLVQKCGQMFRFIAMDVGYIIPTDTEGATNWAYMQTRLVDILTKYYGGLTLADVKLAFELATTGELDDYLPRDKSGKVDKHHYQQFNGEYFAKILNAYKAKQSQVFEKAYNAVPKPQKDVTPEQKEYYGELTKQMCRETYLRYKYSGKLEMELVSDVLIYMWLERIGYAEPVKESPQDRERAFAQYMQRAAQGLVNYYTAHSVRKAGKESPEIDYPAYDIARRKEIQRAFDRMINDELFIDLYL